jgi:NAD(P)-dependent dehydrogenase (short-subunit alcohol dehydrogenase family)
MVSLEAVKASNARLPENHPPNLVAVFVGGTSGIGEFTLRKFAQYAKRPKAYIVGRAQAAADRIIEDLKKVNPDGEYIFITSDVSLIKNVDTVCDEIRRREKAINILFLSCGGMVQNIGRHKIPTSFL